MAIGIIGWIAVTCIIVFVVTTVMRIVKMQGYHQGTMDEAQQWVNAISKVTVPNWQSLETVPGTDQDPEKRKLAAQVYVAAFACALDVIKEEIALNRIEAMADDLKKLIAEDKAARYPIA